MIYPSLAPSYQPPTIFHITIARACQLQEVLSYIDQDNFADDSDPNNYELLSQALPSAFIIRYQVFLMAYK